MTPQERQLLDDLFERLAKLESAPRDPDAVRAIRDGLARAPNAVYALVQSVLVQDEALKRADARIQEMEAQLNGEQPGQAPQGGFLDTMRDAMFGRHDAQSAPPPAQGSVPPVRAGASPWGGGAAQQPGSSPWSGNAGGYAAPAGQPAVGAPGGSFLGTAASAAAGMVAGGMLLNGIRSMFGSHQSQAFGSYRDDPGSQGWGPSAGGGDLSRQAGIDDIGSGGRSAAYDDQSGSSFDLAQQDADDDADADSDDDSDFDSDDDTA
jgi:hypothetical protein